MAISEKELARAESRTADIRKGGYAVSARYNRARRRIVVGLSNGLEIGFRPDLAEGLSAASEEALSEIEISPSGLGLRWPKLDADLYVPALLQGVLGSPSWLARELGAKGGRARTNAKRAAARLNGLKGGRPRKLASG